MTKEDVRLVDDYLSVPTDLKQKFLSELKAAWNDEHNALEEFVLEFNKKKYSTIVSEESNWNDEGKYQFKNITYQFVSFDDKEKPYVCGNNIIDKYNLFLDVPTSKTGSYYTEYYYQFDFPTVLEAKITTVPEVIIPEHKIIEYIPAS